MVEKIPDYVNNEKPTQNNLGAYPEDYDITEMT